MEIPLPLVLMLLPASYHFTTNLWQLLTMLSQRQSHVTTDGKWASQSWCQAPFGSRIIYFIFFYSFCGSISSTSILVQRNCREALSTYSACKMQELNYNKTLYCDSCMKTANFLGNRLLEALHNHQRPLLVNGCIETYSCSYK
jgi:hypothetical protein